MAKKSFTTDNPVMQFISQPEPEPIRKTANRKTPARVPALPEIKSRRVQILVQPSVYEAVKAKAEKNGISVNEAIGIALKKYIER